MEFKRFNHCKHQEEYVTDDPQVITWADLQEAWGQVHSKTDLAWSSFLEQFEAHQPAIVHFLMQMWPLSREAHSEWQLVTLAVWQAFRTVYPNLRPVTTEELSSLMPELQHEFTQPELCLCDHHQSPTMRGIVLRLEHAMDNDRLSRVDGSQVIKNMVLIIEALDRFGTRAGPEDEPAQLPSDLSLDPKPEGGNAE